jgi:hypothetical protein
MVGCVAEAMSGDVSNIQAINSARKSQPLANQRISA